MITETINIVIPVFVIILLGYGLKRIGLIDTAFTFQTNKLVYYVCLPLLLFYKIGSADFVANVNVKLIIGSSLTIFAGFIISLFWSRICRYKPSEQGVFSQGAFRGNLAYMGLAIVFYAYGEEGLTRAGILMGFLVPVLNFFAIIALVLPHSSDESKGILHWSKQIFFNPLIFASIVGISWSFVGIKMPVLLDRSLSIATGMTLPLALIAIGASFSLERLRGDLIKAGLSTAIKITLLPLIALGILVLLGVEGQDLAIGILMAGTPAATATYIMAHQMKGDAELAGTIVMLSTLLSAISYSILLILLRSNGL